MEERILKMSSVILAGMITAALVVLSQFSVVNRKEAKREQMSDLQMLAFYT